MERALTLTAVALLLAACAGGGPEKNVRPRNLVLISLDTLRADRLEAYGYDRPTSPAIGRLAQRGVRFENVIAPSNWTLPSHMTLFTGLEPSAHRVVKPWDRLGAGIRTLGEILRERGYRTFAFTGGALVTGRHGFARGFERYEEPLGFAKALTLARETLEKLGPEEKFFLFLHTYAVHCPYDPPPSYAATFATRPPEDRVETKGRCGRTFFDKMKLTAGQAKYLSDRYDAAIRYADDLLADFFRTLDERGRSSDTLIVLTSDHGEAFLEHGAIGHHDTQYIEALRVPWIMAGPGWEPRVVGQLSGLADVMPTLLDLLGIPGPAGKGVSLRSLVEGRGPGWPGRRVFSECDWKESLQSAITDEHHLLVGGGRSQLFRWRTDPLEREDLTEREAAHAATMQRELAAHFAEMPKVRPVLAPESLPELNEAQRARLRALGYID